MTNRYAIPLVVVSLTTAITGIAWAGPLFFPSTSSTCNATVACLTASNAGTGPGLAGSATAGTGVRGISTGTSATSAGIYGTASTSGTGVSGTSSTSIGIEGHSTGSSGIVAISAGTKPAISGSTIGKATGAGVEGVAANGTGISSSGLVAFTGIGQLTTEALKGTIYALALNGTSGNFFVDQAGDVYTSSYASIACGSGSQTVYFATACAAENKPPANAADSPRTATTGIAGRWAIRAERLGSATLSDGSARIELDPVLARNLVGGSDYHVFLTAADSSSTWLYVAKKTARGFVVREHGGGHDLITFGYRVVADVRPLAYSATTKDPL
jgi:hypothetical protein